ncbi:hypothetical protein GT722_13215 [Clostridium beijerinckii]|nr:hypothetical protein [Clostridium beijerinckii]MZK99168.1 hypothetical protein [Clostridium beijerinckii]MZL18969.1 hypothetical protein [Clostridium beijerinckii]MZL28756.1 hypothetical protein [Clostridium beijerinckii]
MKINTKLKIIVQLPSDSFGMINDNVYGMAAIGDVPRLAFVTNATPKELKNKPNKNIT